MKETKVWLTGQGVLDGRDNNYRELLFNITLQNIFLSLRFFPDLEQTHLTLGRKELILLRDAINDKIKDKVEASASEMK